MKKYPFRLVMGVVLLALLMPAAPSSAASKYKVSLEFSPRLIDVSSDNKSVYTSKIWGTVTGGPVKGKKVTITAKNKDKPSSVRTWKVKLDSKGRYKKNFAPVEGGVWKVDVVMPKSGKVQSGKARHELIAFQWTFLYEHYDKTGAKNTPRGAEGVQLWVGEPPQKDDKWRIGGNLPGERGRRFRESSYLVKEGHTMVADIRGHQCKKISFKVGMSDTSPSDTGSFRLYQKVNGKNHVILQKTMKRGEKEFDVNVPEHKAIRDRIKPSASLRFQVTSDKRSRDAHMLLVNAKVFCTFASKNRR